MGIPSGQNCQGADAPQPRILPRRAEAAASEKKVESQEKTMEPGGILHHFYIYIYVYIYYIYIYICVCV